MAPAVPGIRLNDGNVIPQLGLGVWQISNAQAPEAVGAAIAAGYRLIDSAQGYGNEEGVGRAVRESGLPREQIFVTSKLRNSDHAYDTAIRSSRESLKQLGLDYVDLFLIHWPMPEVNRYTEAWRALVELQKEGLFRSIGVSNFRPEHIERIVGETGVTPAVNQIELNPAHQQQAVREFHQQRGIAIESYSPLGRGAAVANPTIREIAGRHAKTPAQAILRWHIQQGLIVIPKTSHPERMRENIAIFDFALDERDMRDFAEMERPGGR